MTVYALGAKVLVPHREGCWGHEAGGYRCWEGVERDRDKIGRKHPGGFWEWHRFRCNDPECPSVAIVREDILTEYVNQLVASSLPSKAEAV